MSERLNMIRMRVARLLLDLATKIAPVGITGTASGDDGVIGVTATVGVELSGAAASAMAFGDRLYSEAGVIR